MPDGHRNGAEDRSNGRPASDGPAIHGSREALPADFPSPSENVADDAELSGLDAASPQPSQADTAHVQPAAAAMPNPGNEPPMNVVAEGERQLILARSAQQTRRSFLVGGLAAAAGWGIFEWIDYSRPVGRLQAPLRDSLNVDAAVNRAVWAEHGLAPEYPISMAVPLRLNGSIGMDEALEPASWRLQMAGVRNAVASPFYVQDVTAWEYRYAGSMPDTQAADDVKSAPGNGKQSKTGGSKGAGSDKGHAPAAQQSKGQGSASDNSDQPKADVKNNAQAVGGNAVQSAQNASSPLNPGGAADSAAGAAIAAKFQAMARNALPGGQRKRNVGDDEAGPSYSSLDIGTPGLLLTMDELRKLPRVEFCTQFKCIEGWSNITHWAGVRLRDLLDLHPPAQQNGKDPAYIYMETPDGNYYGGYDMAAARHPQSLLVMEMDGQPLTAHHGAPLRLHMPIKYGYKQLKRIGLIAYSFQKPDDYWTHLGYDWFAGL